MSLSKSCSRCYYREECCGKSVCEYYDPVGGKMSDKNIEKLIESNRDKFYEEWLEYIDGFYK